MCLALDLIGALVVGLLAIELLPLWTAFFVCLGVVGWLVYKLCRV